MQVKPEQLKRQQEIMKALGFFVGTPDGVWGVGSIQAMKAFERSEKFLPGLPNNGLPLRDIAPYPAGFSLGRDGLFNHPALEAAKAAGVKDVPKTTEVPVAEPVTEVVPPDAHAPIVQVNRNHVAKK